MKLEVCLAAMPIRHLWAIARAHDIPCDRALPKAEVVAKLEAELLRPDVVAAALDGLTVDQRQALDALMVAGGRMPWRPFREQFGDVRPYRPWREDAPPEPWDDPISPAERLWFLGLIFRFPRRPRSGLEVSVRIPEDLLTLLPPPQGPDIPEPLAVPATKRRLRRPEMTTDVALLISLLHRDDVRPLWERWLPQRCFRELNQRLSVPEDLSAARSELQTGRLRFVHAVAEAADLVGMAGPWLKPTPRAWAWLDETPADRYQALWTAWRHDSDATWAVWHAYRLPGHDTEVALEVLELVLDGLSRLAVGALYPLASFVANLVETAPVLSALPPLWRDDEVRDRGAEIVSELLVGPLSWWGVVVIAEEADAPAFALTPLGEWLLTGQDVFPRPEAQPFRVEQDLTVQMPEAPDLQDLVRVESLAEWRGWVERRPACACLCGRQAKADRRCYQVTQDSLSRALSRGVSLPETIEALSRGEGGLSAVPHAVLEAWAAESEAVTLRRATLLQTRDAERLQALSANRAVRRHFRETLSPRAVAVDGGRVDLLVRALKRQGIYPRVDVPPNANDPAASWAPADSGAAQLWVAGRVYARLSRWIDLPQPMPAAVLDELAAQMDEATYAAAQQAADDVIERLAAVMDGWTRYPLPAAGLSAEAQAGLSPEETLPVIEQAITEGRTLRMTYWTAGREERTTRTVEPYRIEWRGDVPYLVGYCHARMDERVFRVDRIERLKVGKLES